jgi:hypothetical protein
LRVEITSSEFPVSPRAPQLLAIDLDVDATNPSMPTATFVDGFETGFAGWTLLSLDLDKASNAESDGYRCQYQDPDKPDSNSYGNTWCYLGFAAGQPTPNDWHVQANGGPGEARAFLGLYSAHYGSHVSGIDTTSMSQLDALATRPTPPLRLAARVCAADPAADKRSCNDEGDCMAIGGGPCVAASPELSFKHQVSAMDGRTIGSYGALDRAVVQVLPAAGRSWEKIAPSVNIYDMPAADKYWQCKFDPIDDGNDEDDYFDPTDPNRRYGPSSTCAPEFVFSFMGLTEVPYFSFDDRGWASDGPAMSGSLGPGYWVESKFDLSRYRGRSVRLRLLYTTMKDEDHPTWKAFGFDTAGDDGWYVDDVRVTQTLGSSSATITSDVSDNGGLPGNLDGDARGDDCDCAPADPAAFALAEVTGIRFQDDVTFTWNPSAPMFGSGTVNDVVRGVTAELPVGDGASEVCLASGPGATTTDTEAPPVGTAFWYLVRARNACGVGGYGSQSDESPRTTPACLP